MADLADIYYDPGEPPEPCMDCGRVVGCACPRCDACGDPRPQCSCEPCGDCGAYPDEACAPRCSLAARWDAPEDDLRADDLRRLLDSPDAFEEAAF